VIQVIESGWPKRANFKKRRKFAAPFLGVAFGEFSWLLQLSTCELISCFRALKSRWLCHSAREMSRHHPDLVLCRKQPGTAIGRLCEKCNGKCPICDSFVNPSVLVRICDECDYGQQEGKCVICGAAGVADAFYCRECVQCEKDRDGCPKVINLGSSKTDLFYERKKYNFKKR